MIERYRREAQADLRGCLIGGLVILAGAGVVIVWILLR